MTRNQIAKAEYLERKRSNLANEDIKRQQLAEEVSNNMRNFRINLDKNEITRLYNNQLNARELKKIRDNLRISLEQLAQDSRANDIKSQLNDLNLRIAEARNETELQKSMLNGIIGLITGTTIAIIRSDKNNSDDPSPGEPNVATWINDEFERASENKEPKASVINKITDFIANAAAPTAAGIGALVGSIFGTPVYATSVETSPTAFKQNSGGVVQYNIVDEVRQNKGVIGQGINRILKRNENANEIPAENQHSPEVKASRPIVASIPAASQTARIIEAPSRGNGPGESKSYYEEQDRRRNTSTSGGTDYHLSGGIKSSGVIISPGANI